MKVRIRGAFRPKVSMLSHIFPSGGVKGRREEEREKDRESGYILGDR